MMDNISQFSSNDAPTVAGALSSAADEGMSSYAIDLLEGASDADNGETDTLTVANVTGLVDGLTLSGTNLIVDPDSEAFDSMAAGETREISITYDVVDAQGASVAQSLNLTITGTNDAPVVSAITATDATEDDATQTINLLDGQSDVDTGATLSATDITVTDDLGNPVAFTDNGDGTISIDPNQYDALAASESRTVTVSYKVSDGSAATANTATLIITGSNDAPTVAGALSSAADEGMSSYAIDLLEGASDADNGETDTLTVANVTGLVDGLTLSGTNLIVDPDSEAFDSMAAGETREISITYDVVDAQGASVAQSLNLTITGTNDAPVVSAITATDATEDDATQTINLLDGQSDVDTGATLSATDITVTDDLGNPVAFTDNGDGTISIDPNQYDALAASESRTVTVSYKVSDGSAATANTATLIITGSNDAPTVAGALSSAADEGMSSYAIDLLEGASDADNGETDTLTVANVTGLVDGLTLSGTNLIVDPDSEAFDSMAAGETREISITYDVVDAQGASVAQSLNLTITGTNDAPVVSAITAADATEDDATQTINLLDGQSDVDTGATLSATDITVTDDLGNPVAFTDNGDGTISIDPNQYDALAASESRTVTVSYKVSDGSAATANTATLIITGSNDAPTVAGALSSAADEGMSSYAIDLLEGASDADNGETDTLTVANVTGLVDGLTLSGTNLIVDPDSEAFDSMAAGETREISITYDVVDAQGASVAQSLNLTITGTNDAPVVSAITAADATEDDATQTINLLDGQSDVDTGATLSATDITVTDDLGNPVAFTDNGDGTISIDPNQYDALAASESRTVTVSYKVSDGSAAAANTATLIITGSNDAPTVAGALSSAADEGMSSYAIDLLEGASDADNGETDTLTVANVTGLVDGLTLSGTNLIVDPDSEAFDSMAAGETREISITYDVVDAQGASVAQSLNLTITGTNDAPVVKNLYASANEDGPSVTVVADYFDKDTSDTLTISIDTTGTMGNVKDNGDGTFTYHPNGRFEYLNPMEVANDSFTYTVTDNHGVATTKTVSIAVQGMLEPSKIVASDGASSDCFGHTFATNRYGVMVAGAYGDDYPSAGQQGSYSGSIYVYIPDSNGGYTETKLISSDLAPDDRYGISASINDAGTIVVGALFDDDRGVTSGSVYVYRTDGNGGYYETKLLASDGQSGDWFGGGVSINNEGVIAVGAFYADIDEQQNTGAVYIYTPDGSGNYTETKVIASDGGASDQFGQNLKLNDNGVLIVGAILNDENGENAGAVYIYTPDGHGDYTETKLIASDGNANDWFGRALDMNATGVLVVGAFFAEDDIGPQDAGAVYVYTPDGNGGYTEGKLVALDRAAGDRFGYAVAINDDGVIVVGAHTDDDQGSDSGSVYVFKPDGSGGYDEYKITAPDGKAGDVFGSHVTIMDDGTILVAAEKGDGGSTNDTGAIYTFTPNEDGDYVAYDGTIYSSVSADGLDSIPFEEGMLEPSKIVASDGASSDCFGHTFATNRYGVMVAGAYGDDYPSAGQQGSYSGSIYVYIPDSNGGYTETKLISSDLAPDDRYGISASINDAGTIVVGALFDDDRGVTSGSVYVYRTDGNGGYYETKLLASDGQSGDWFGGGVSINNEGVIAVGAFYADIDEQQNTGAVYIYTPDGSGNYTETKVIASDGGASDQFGQNLKLNDNGVLIVGAILNDENGENAGAVYIYTPDGHGDYTETKLIASDGNANDWFGRALDMNATGVLVVGAFFAEDDIGPQDAGAVYVYTPDGNGGYTEGKLVALDRAAGDRFGYAVAINDDGVIVVGAHTDDDQGSDSGSVYVFKPDGSGGYDEYKITAPDGKAGDVFGSHVTIMDDGTILVAAEKGDGGSTNDTGAIYTFTPNEDGDYVAYDGTIYSSVSADGLDSIPFEEGMLEPSKIVASDGASSDCFGHTFATNRYGVMVAGAYGDDYPSAGQQGSYSGSIYVYIPDSNGGYTETKLISSDLAPDDRYGISASINDAGTIVVGALFDDDRGVTSGSVYVYRTDGNGGYYETKLLASDGQLGDRFGNGVSINNEGVIAVGAFYADIDEQQNTGAVYIYTPDGSGNYTETKVIASDGGASDQFGQNLKLNDNGVLIVGAILNDENGENAGAVYIYTPDGHGDYTETKLIASDGNANDWFGRALDMNATGVLVVGAFFAEDDIGPQDAGAVYVYTPDGNGGYTEGKLVALDRAAGDRFGYAVAINDDGVIVVGAHTDDDQGSDSGSVYVFKPDGSGGYDEYKITAPDGKAGDVFGSHVTIMDDGTILVAAEKGDGGSTNDTGAIYTFTPNEDGDYVAYDGTIYSSNGTGVSASNGAAASSIVGSDNDNILSGGDGDDTIIGGTGDDVLYGSGGDDAFIFADGNGNDVICDFDTNIDSHDVIDLSDCSRFSDFASVLAVAADQGSDVLISLDDNNSLLLKDVSVSDLHQDDFRFA